MHIFILLLLIFNISYSPAFAEKSLLTCNESLQLKIIDPQSRAQAIHELKSYYQTQSLILKDRLTELSKNSNVEYDVVVIGGGPATIAFIAGLRAESPDLKILVLDESATLSPAFEGPGRALIFNSITAFHPDETINSHFFPDHFIQLPEFLDFKEGIKIHPTGEDIAALTWSQFSRLNADLLLNTQATDIVFDQHSHFSQITTRENLKISAQLTVIATGQGQPQLDFLNVQDKSKVLAKIKESEQNPEELGIETYLQSLTYMNQQQLDPVKYQHKRIAIIGGGDASLNLLENLFAFKVPAQANHINLKLRRPLRIVNYGSKVVPPNRKKFMNENKRRYHHLRGVGGLFVEKGFPLPADVEDLRPLLGDRIVFKEQQAKNIQVLENKLVRVEEANGEFEDFDHVIIATGYTNEATELIDQKVANVSSYSYDQIPDSLSPILSDIVISGGSYAPGSIDVSAEDINYNNVRLGFQVKNQNVYLIANAAGAHLIVSDEEALDGSSGAHAKNQDKTRSASYSKYTLQHMLPRAHQAGIYLYRKHFLK